MQSTRSSTPILYRTPTAAEILAFDQKPLGVFGRLEQRPFREIHVFSYEKTKKVLETKLEEQNDEKNKTLKKRKSSNDNNKDFKFKVNQKRAFIAQCFQNHSNASLASICRLTNSDFTTVKRVIHDLQFQGEPDQYEYNHIKLQPELEQLHRSIDHLSESFKTVTDLKRQHSGFSRKRILKELHSRGLHWDRLPKQRKKERFEQPNSQRSLQSDQPPSPGFR